MTEQTEIGSKAERDIHLPLNPLRPYAPSISPMTRDEEPIGKASNV